MKFIALFFIFLSFGLESRAFFSPYNPGPGYLPPSYSYQQQPFQQQGFYQQSPYQQQGYPPQAFYQQRPMAQGQGASSFFTCSASSCGTLRGFKQCLGSPSSPYRYFIFHPEAIKDVRAFQRLRAFTTVHPNCYAQFCNRVCSEVPKKFQPAPVQQAQPQQSEDDESMSEFSDSDASSETASQASAARNTPLKRPSWFSRQRDRFHQNDRWRAGEFEKRSAIQGQVGKLCTRKDLIGSEIRLLCSECAPYLKRDRKMIKSCEEEIHYKAPPKVTEGERQTPGRRMVHAQQAPSENWGFEGLKSHQVTSSQEGGDIFTNAQGDTIRIVNGRPITIARQGGKPPAKAKEALTQAQINQEIQQQERIDAASEAGSQTSRGSQSSQRSKVEVPQGRQPVPLSAEALAQHSAAIQKWGEGIPQMTHGPVLQSQRGQPPSQSAPSEDPVSDEESESEGESEASSDFSEEE